MSAHPSHDVRPCCDGDRGEPTCDRPDYCHRCGYDEESPDELAAPCPGPRQ